jgi:hypothetical protein
MADDPETAIAEWFRYLAELGLPAGRAIPHDHHLWGLDLIAADLSTQARLAAVGLWLPQPTRRSWPPFQAAGEALWREGWAGLVAPSAARQGALVACVFDQGSWPPAGCMPVKSVEIDRVPAPPTGIAT